MIKWRGKWIDVVEDVKTKWEYVSRKDCDGVVTILATTPDKELILVKQYRPPIGKHVIEFPAGLIDMGENPRDAAVRELKEETGWEGRVIGSTPFLVKSPGITDEQTTIITIEAYNWKAQDLQDEEKITVINLPMNKESIYHFLRDMEHNKEEVTMSSSVYLYLLSEVLR